MLPESPSSLNPGNPGNLPGSPRGSAATPCAASDPLLAELTAILERIARLEEYEGPLLFARYQQELGGMELQLLQIQVACQAMIRRIELAQQGINRGQGMSPARLREIESTVTGELQAWRQEIESREESLRRSLLLMAGLSTAPLVDAGRLKMLYRQLVRWLHPDVAPEEAELHARYWTAIQHAYHQGELEVLEALAHVVARELEERYGPDFSRHAGVTDQERLRELVRHHAARLAALQNTPPHCHAARLNDAAWVAAKKAELTDILARESQRLEQLTEHFAALQWAELTDHEHATAPTGHPSSPDDQDDGEPDARAALRPGDLSPGNPCGGLAVP